jgi:hypothetical protein
MRHAFPKSIQKVAALLWLAAALYGSFNQADAQSVPNEAQSNGPSYWMHNGSLMRMSRAASGEITVIYERVKDEMAATIRNGDRLLAVMEHRGTLSGSAWRFKRGCNAAAYSVIGNYTDATRSTFVLEGAFPEWNGCEVKGYSRNGSLAQLEFTRSSSPDTVTATTVRPVTAGAATSSLVQFEPNSISPPFAEQSRMSRPDAEARCRADLTTAHASAQQIKLQLSESGEIRAGSNVKLSWSLPHLPVGRDERTFYLHIDLPMETDLEVDAFRFAGVHEWHATDRPGGPYGTIKEYYPVAPNIKRLNIPLNSQDSHSPREIAFSFNRSGLAKISAHVSLASASNFSLPCLWVKLTRTASVDVVVQPRPSRFDSPKQCHQLANGHSPLTLTRTAATSTLEVGQITTFEWSYGRSISSDCKAPLYLLVSLPATARLAGDGFIALGKGARGPFGITKDQEQLRLFVPLHENGRPRDGRFQVTFHEAGPASVNASVVEVPAWRVNPINAEDFDGGRAEPLLLPENSITLTVLPGAPQVTIEDPFTLDRPVRVIDDKSMKYTLQVFPGFYRIFDRVSGELILQRVGTDPEFSPTSRFVVAFLEDQHSIEVVDLVSKARVGGLRSEERGTYTGRGILPVMWAQADSFVFIAPNNGDGELYNLMVDRPPARIELSGSKGDSFRGRPVLLDIELGGFVFANWADRAHREITLVDILSTKSPAQEKRAVAPRFLLNNWAPRDFSSFQWQLGADRRFTSFESSPPSLSEMMKSLEGTLFATAELREQRKRETVQRHAESLQQYQYLDARREKHVVRDQWSSPVSVARAASPLGSKSRGQPLNAKAQVTEQLTALFGLTLQVNRERERPLGPLSKKTYITPLPGDTTEDRELAVAILEQANGEWFRRWLPQWEGRDLKWRHYKTLDEIPQNFACEYDTPVGTFGRFVDPARVMGRTAWRGEANTNWLIQQDCWGGSGWRSVQLGLFIKAKGKSPEMIPLTGDRQDHEEQYGLNSGKLARGALTLDDVLLVAMPNRKVLIFDLRARKRLALLTNVDGAEFASEMWLTKDRQRFVLLTEGGRLSVHDVKTGKANLFGFHLDDESILYRHDGYFHSTPEGAHFVQLKFPGMPGTHSFHQFAATLNRPDLVKAALAGQNAGPAPQLTAPPTLRIDVAAHTSGGERRADVSYDASSVTDLKSLTLFVDGRPLQDIALDGAARKGKLDVKVPNDARWLSAIAVDVKGFESVPQEVKLDLPTGNADSTLHIIAFGNDEYRDRAFEGLTGAGVDAKRFTDAIQEVGATVYGRVAPLKELSPQTLREDLPAHIREVVARAKEGDTIVVFAAGHGEVGPDGRFYLINWGTRKSDLPGTALAWDEIAKAFDGVKARVVVFLDACRAGTAGAATNDQAALSLTSRSNSIAVIAAAKGRQESKELPSKGGGYFTNAIIDALTKSRARTDLNGNGVIELSELYGAIKGVVVQQSNGKQTPWISRNRMVGPVPLF